jgi:RNA polymerase sigma-70 factor (ECF subfamily)
MFSFEEKLDPCKRRDLCLLLLGAITLISYADQMQESTDEQLMQNYANGDAACFDLLYARHKGALYRYIKRQINDAATANDLYQGVWEKIIKARRKYKTTTPFKAWMFRIAQNHLIDHYRRQKPVDSMDEQELDAQHLNTAQLNAGGPNEMNATYGHPGESQTGPTQALIDEQQQYNLLQQIAALPEEQRSTLLLKLEAGLKMEQIAEVTGVTRETVKSRLRYAVNKLKRNLLE